MKQYLLVFLFSIGAITIPAFLIAIGIYLIWNIFLAPFLIFIGIISILGQIYNMFFQKKTYEIIENIKLKRAEIEASQNVEVSCAYCKERNIIPIKLSTRNTFNCNKCKHENLIIFQFATAQITTPLTIPQYGAIDANT